MSILNDDRRYSDDPDEYMAWLNEVKREYREDEYDDDYGYEEYEEDD